MNLTHLNNFEITKYKFMHKTSQIIPTSVICIKSSKNIFLLDFIIK